MDDEEKYFHEMLALLQRDYERAAKPYVDQLVKIHSLKPRTSFIFDPKFIAMLGMQAVTPPTTQQPGSPQGN
jgi:hypothetical protein